MLNRKKVIYLLSFITTIIITFIPKLGIKIDGTYLLFGFPAEWLGYYGGGQFSFNLFGLLFNLFFFYFLFLLLSKMLKKILNKIDQKRDKTKEFNEKQF